MKYVAVIKLARTGTEVRYADEWPHSIDGLRYYWTDGNFGCDCNRSLSFRRALYPQAPAGDVTWNSRLPRVWCSDGRYVVPYIELEDGTRMEIDK